MPEFPVKVKDPNAVLPYYWVWYPWLDGLTLTTKDVTISPSGELTLDSSEIVPSSVEIEDVTYPPDTVVEAWLSAGTHGKDYNVTCRVTVTDNGDTRQDDRTIQFKCRQR